MAYEIEWLVPQRILLAVPSGTVTQEEIINVNSTVKNILLEGTPPVHVIIDALAVESFPANPKLHLENAGWLKDKSIGWVILMTKNPLAKMIIHIVTQTMQTRYRNFPDQEAALTFLHEMDETLPEVRGQF